MRLVPFDEDKSKLKLTPVDEEPAQLKLVPEETPESSAIGAFGRQALHGALPAAGGLAAAGVGAELGGAVGSLGGPIGTVAGGLAGGLAGAIGGSALVSKIQNMIPENVRAAVGLGEAQQRADVEQHPYASFAGGMAPYAVAMQPGGGLKLAATGAAIGGGIETGSELAGEGKLDPAKIAMATAGGALFNKPTAVGRALLAPGGKVGAAIAQRGKPVAPAEQPLKLAPVDEGVPLTPRDIGMPEPVPQAVGAEAAPPVAVPTKLPRIAQLETEDDLFKAMRSGPQAESIRFAKDFEVAPPEMKMADTAALRYRAAEGDPNVPRDPQQEALFARNVAPVREESKQAFLRVKELKGKNFTTEEQKMLDLESLDPTYMPRIRLDKILKKGSLMDVTPQTQRSGGIGDAPSLHDRSLYTINSPTGERQIVRMTDRTLSKWTGKDWEKITVDTPKAAPLPKGAPVPAGYELTKKAIPDFEHGQTVSINGRLWTIKNARTEELHAANIPDEHGKPLRFLQNDLIAALYSRMRLRNAETELRALQRIKDDPVVGKYMTTDRRAAKPDWIPTRMPGYANYKMDPRIAHILDDFAPAPHSDANTYLEAMSRANRAMIGTLFWNPVPHILNVAGHAIVANGWQNFNPLHWPESLRNVGKAMKEVTTLGPLYESLLKHGSSLIYSRVSELDMLPEMIKKTGIDLQKMEGFQGIARRIGVKPVELYNAFMKASNKTLWWAGDVFMMHRVLELEAKGLSRVEAIRAAERDIPNYRVPAEVWNGPGGRLMSQGLRNTSINLFGRFHYGVARGLLTIVKDLAVGDKEAKLEAMGKAISLAVLSGVIYPFLADPLVRAITGNKDVEAARRGPTGPVQTAIEAAHAGKITDWNAVARAVGFMKSPALNLLEGISTNTDWRGQKIFEPAASLTARVGQGLEHLATTAFVPYQQFKRYAKEPNPWAAFGADTAIGSRKMPPLMGWSATIGERSARARAKAAAEGKRGKIEQLTTDEP